MMTRGRAGCRPCAALRDALNSRSNAVLDNELNRLFSLASWDVIIMLDVKHALVLDVLADQKERVIIQLHPAKDIGQDVLAVWLS